MIEIRDLPKRYGSKTAVDHLTVTVGPGVVTGFLAPNGAGKSTAMRAILGLDRPTGGQVLVSGRRYVDTGAAHGLYLRRQSWLRATAGARSRIVLPGSHHS